MQSATAIAIPPRSETTLRRWGETYLELKRAQGLRSAQSIACVWRCHVEEADFIDARIDEIRRVHLRAFLRTLANKRARHARITTDGRRTDPTGRTLSRKTVRGVLQVLHNAFA